MKATFLPEPPSIQEKLWMRERGGEKEREKQKRQTQTGRGAAGNEEFPRVFQSYHPAEEKNQMKTARM